MELFKNINPKKLFEPSYIFEKTPSANSDYLYLAIVFGLFIVLAIVFWFIYGKKKKNLPVLSSLQGRFFNIFFYTGISGLVLIFFRFQQIPYLGSRLFLLILILVFIIWSIYLLYFYFKILPQKISKFREEQIYNKYLP